MKVTRGKRKSLVIEAGRWRIRFAIGRFRWGWEREYRFGGWTGVLSTKFFLITFLQKMEHEQRKVATNAKL